MYLFVILIIGFVIISLIMPWVQQSRINQLTQEIKDLRASLAILLEKAGVANLIASNPKEVTAKLVEQPKPEKTVYVAPKEKIVWKEKSKKKAQEQKVSFEQQFGAKLPVWVGGVALALAGFFLVKYSIDIGLLNPTVRIVLGLIFGGCLLAAGEWIMQKKSSIANGERIAQALSGAAIADLYVCIYAATNLYHLIPSYIGFAGLAAVTATAVIRSLRHGMPIAVLGLLGGLLTPAMVSSENPSAPILFMYLYFVITGLMVVIRRQNWWALSIPTVCGAFLWVMAWVFGGHYTPNDSLWLGLFLLAVCATVAGASKEKYESKKDTLISSKPVFLLNYVSAGTALVLMGIIAAKSSFGMMEWVLFGLLASGSIFLAYFNQKLYGFVPLLSMAVTAVMLLTWHHNDPQYFSLIITCFAVLYIGSGYLLQLRSPAPLLWAGLAAATSIGYYLIAYFELRHTGITDGIPAFWGLLALVLATLSVTAVQEIKTALKSGRQEMLAVYASTATAFISLGLSIELKHEFLSIAFAAQVLAIAWLNTRFEIKALRYIAGVLACVFAYLLIPQILLLFQLTMYSVFEISFYAQKSVPIVDWPAFQLGLPALFFAAASYFLREEKDDRLVRALEISAVALLGVMGYYLIRHAFHMDENILFVKAGFIERGVLTNIIFVFGVACLFIGNKFSRPAVSLSGIIVAGVAAFRIGYFDFFLYNPLWSSQEVGELPILNGLLITYGLPVIWAIAAIKILPDQYRERAGRIGYALAFLLAFAFISLNIRQLYNGAHLNGPITSSAEIYTYSIVWLLFGIGLLFFGTLRQDRMIRIASLAIMILTVGKVFLYDASELTGLYRVLSFFGLGLSLLGLSWFYTRFVFSQKK